MRLTKDQRGVTGISETASSSPVVGDIRWQVEMRPEDGRTMLIERTMPDFIDAVMNLS